MAGYNIYRSNNGENGVYQKLNKFPLTAAYYLMIILLNLLPIIIKSQQSHSMGMKVAEPAYRTWTSYPVVSPFPRQLTVGAYSSESCPNIVADVDNDGKQEISWLCEDRYETRTVI